MNQSTALYSHVVQDILKAVNECGITLVADGKKLRYHPKSKMTPSLARRLQDNKHAIIEALSINSKTSPNARQKVLSVLSVSEPSRALWSKDELKMLHEGNISPDCMALVTQLQEVFADDGLTIESITPVSDDDGEATEP